MPPNFLEAAPRVPFPLVQLRLHDRKRDATRDQLEHADVVIAELPGRLRTDVEHAKELVLDLDRNAEKRLQPFLPQDRVHDLRMVGVVDDRRVPPGRDSARETGSDRDPDPLLHLLLEAFGSARNDHLLALVQQQNCDRVYSKRRPDLIEKVAEQVLEGDLDTLGVFGGGTAVAGGNADLLRHPSNGIAGKTRSRARGPAHPLLTTQRRARAGRPRARGPPAPASRAHRALLPTR